MRARRLGTIIGIVGLSTALMGVSAAGAGPSGSDKKFCKAVVKTAITFNQIEEEPTAAQLDKIERLLTRVGDNAPDEVADAADTAVTALRDDPEAAFGDPAVVAAISEVDAWVVDNCGYEVVQVTGLDYEFEGIPDTLDTGLVLFEFTNEGDELHEIGIARLKGDITLEEALEEEGDENIEFVGGTFAAQGETSVAYVRFKKAGTYGAACFIPVGSTDHEAAETADGPPHAVEGMAAEFEVKKKGK